MPESREDRYRKMREEIYERMRKEGRTYRHMTEMERDEFFAHSCRMIADGIIQHGFGSIHETLTRIISLYNTNELFNIK